MNNANFLSTKVSSLTAAVNFYMDDTDFAYIMKRETFYTFILCKIPSPRSPESRTYNKKYWKYYYQNSMNLAKIGAVN